MFIVAVIAVFILLFFVCSVILGIAAQGVQPNHITGWGLVVSICITILLVYYNVI